LDRCVAIREHDDVVSGGDLLADCVVENGRPRPSSTPRQDGVWRCRRLVIPPLPVMAFARLRIGRGVVAFPFELAFVAELVDSVSDTRDGGGQIDATVAVLYGARVTRYDWRCVGVAELVDSVSDTRDGGGQIDATGAVP